MFISEDSKLLQIRGSIRVLYNWKFVVRTRPYSIQRPSCNRKDNRLND